MKRIIGLVFVFTFLITDGPRAAIVLDFEGPPDATILSNQYAGFSFSNAQILTASASLNEFEFPPHSGVNVALLGAGLIGTGMVSRRRSKRAIC
jgi:hypothetical protein